MASYALVIGIGEYQHPGSFQSLGKPVGDAEAIARCLQMTGDFRVELLVRPEETTYLALKQKLKQFIHQRSRQAEVALIYYTGHAFPVVDGFAEETEVFLAARDCEVAWDAGQISSQERGLSLAGLSKLLAKADLGNLVMLLDCCHGGALIEPEALRQVFGAFRSKNYWLMTSCRSFEQSWAKKSDAHSLFSGAVLRGLAAEQVDERGEVPAGKLFSFVTEALRRERQEPQQLSVGGEIILVRHRQSAPAEVVSEECPYQVLEAFTAESQHFFFGRQDDVAELRKRLMESGFVPVVGPSGMGKSSVVRAGLIPRLEAECYQVITMKPDEDPFWMLKQALKQHWDGKISQGEQRRLWEQLETDRENEQGLVLLAEAMPGTEPLLLVVDQFEEVFTLCKLEVARAFVRQLVAVGQVASEQSFRLAIVLTMRSEFVNDWLVTGQPPRVLQEQTLFIGPLLNTGEAEAEQRLTQAIVRPAQVQGYDFGEGLLELILADVEAEPNSLPLLEFALTQLWAERDQERRLLTAVAYRRIGGLKGALNQRAEAVYGSLSEAEKDWARRVCLQLVRIGKGETDTRQRQPKAKLLQLANGSVAQEQQIKDVIGDLVKGRLLVSDGDDSGATIDLAHEALMSGWERFVGWQQQDRDRQRLKQGVEDALEKWQEQGQDEKYLMQGGLLAELQALEQEKQEQILSTSALTNFFAVSDKKKRQEKRQYVLHNLTQKIKNYEIEFEDGKTINPIITVLEHAREFIESSKEICDFDRFKGLLFRALKLSFGQDFFSKEHIPIGQFI